MPENKILLNSRFIEDTHWKMEINLEGLVSSAGKRVKDEYNGGSYVDYPLRKAKKLLKLIRDYGTEDDFRKMDEWMPKNKKLQQYWEDLK